ncbi:MAG TPA: helix-turn-helix transcriptional regulator [Selenomonadales bacterium]|nr:helix-turn-helix transcriptional regulator [Selenomonadales bacterium]
MKPNEIRAELLLKGIRPAMIAGKLKVSRAAVSNVISGKFKSLRIQEEIAQVIDRTVEEIWPQWAA